jgi:hypothetical protein
MCMRNEQLVITRLGSLKQNLCDNDMSGQVYVPVVLISVVPTGLDTAFTTDPFRTKEEVSVHVENRSPAKY